MVGLSWGFQGEVLVGGLSGVEEGLGLAGIPCCCEGWMMRWQPVIGGDRHELSVLLLGVGVLAEMGYL